MNGLILMILIDVRLTSHHLVSGSRAGCFVDGVFPCTIAAQQPVVQGMQYHPRGLVHAFTHPCGSVTGQLPQQKVGLGNRLSGGGVWMGF